MTLAPDRKEHATKLLLQLGNGLTHKSAIRAFIKSARSFGFENCLCMGYSTLTTKCSRLYFSNWPKDWIRTYRREYFLKDDPLMAMTRRDVAPVMWSRGTDNPAIPDSHRVALAATSFGWDCVYAVPRHGPMGYIGVIGMSATRPPELDAEDHVIIQAVATRVHDLCRSSTDTNSSRLRDVQFSEREIECMQWVAQGKTDAEIAKIVGISAATAHFHIENVKRKLSTRSRTEAVAVLVFEGLLS